MSSLHFLAVSSVDLNAGSNAGGTRVDIRGLLLDDDSEEPVRVIVGGQICH